ncbi:hypothetical protein [Brevundimonas sp.]|uniref:hypothetical protein n=1 Tax=Brevundimonas sp. TaxID=1871086 RepID=UPI003F6E5A74
MTDWIKAINPTAPITTEGEALGAARASAIGVGVGVVVGIVGIVQMIVKKDEIAAAAQAAAGADPAAASMAGAMAQGMLYVAIAFVVIQAIIAFVQWAKPNIIIPILFLVLVIGGFALAMIGQMMPSPVERPEIPMWQTALTGIIALVQTVLHISGIRGASKLDKIRFQAANQDDNY